MDTRGTWNLKKIPHPIIGLYILKCNPYTLLCEAHVLNEIDVLWAPSYPLKL